jgi:exopolysaccharide biosynthesis polyprenyl glycosylphosphotransferase
VRSRDEATRAHRSSGPRDHVRALRPARPVRELEPLPALEAVAETEVATGGPRLRRILFGTDLLTATLGFALTLALPIVLSGFDGAAARAVLVTAVAVTVALVAIGAQGLYRSRACGVRAVETVRLGRASAVAAVAALVVADLVGLSLGLVPVVLGAGLTWFLLSAARGLYAAWLRKHRSLGRFCRRVVVVGTGDEAYELFKLVDQHPELGLRVSGVVGPRHALAQWDGEADWLGELADVTAAVSASGANGVIVAASDISADDLNRVVRGLLRAGIHVQLSSGLRGIDQRRLRSLPLAHEPLFYLEPASLSSWQLLAKRVLDLVLAGIIFVLALPVLAIAALAVKLGDGGSVLFRQTRVGHNGETFGLLKLRTMVPDAEERLVDLTFANEREGGPLFKLSQDPRRTRVGRILERTSLDGLPQLINVLRGEMSLVGPRPALPHEVAQFDDELLDRQRVMPGITGLWQVEGRENPAFDVYRRLDLFYVENWSVGFDLAILMSTFQSVLMRLAWRSKSTELTVTPEMADSALV